MQIVRLVKWAGKAFLCRLLEAQVRRLRAANDFTIVAVAGSVGKTSTKLAIAQMLERQAAVCYQRGNYNDRLTVPLVVFGQTEPSLFNIPAWLRILWQNRRALKQPYPYQYVVLELGTDGPGQLKRFAYLQPEIGVLTAIADEHMEQFGTLETVAEEELTLQRFSKTFLVNADDTPAAYIGTLPALTYGTGHDVDYQLSDWKAANLTQPTAKLRLRKQPAFDVKLAMIGVQGAKISLAAAAVADLLGYDAGRIANTLATLEPVPGRMQLLNAKKQGLIIDDTYNASPLAVKAALDVLYSVKTTQRIAILGNMNELGDTSPSAHEQIGNYCDPKKLDLVVTIGLDANKYLAAAAESKGCLVARFDDAIAAGKYIAVRLKDRAVILAKGSQNGVYAEEAVKQLLADDKDALKLVRQSPAWMAKKGK